MFTNQPTIRYVNYKDEYRLKDEQYDIRVQASIFLTTIKNKGWPPYEHLNMAKLKYFYDTYVITKELATRLKKKHRSAKTRIIILAKRK